MNWNCLYRSWVGAMVAAVGLSTTLASADGDPKEIDISGAVVHGALGNKANQTITWDFGGPVAITGVGWSGSYCTSPGTIHWVAENRIAVGEEGEGSALIIAPGGPNNTSPCPNCFPLDSGGVLKVHEFGACAIPIVSGVVELEFFTTFAAQPPAGSWCKDSTITIQYIEIEAPGAPCPGDVNDDGVVDVLDLLDLLDCWGPVEPGCEDADFNKDDEVDVLDLLTLLDNWGECPAGGPEFTGACCFGDAVCEQLTEQECDAVKDSIYLGDLCECDDFVCPGEPAECPQGEFNEGEDCGADINGGCNSFPNVYGTVCCGDVITGNAWASGEVRDTDWYTLVVDEVHCLEITLEHGFGALGADLFLLNTDCDDIQILDTGEVIGAGVLLLRTTVGAGTYRVIVAPGGFGGLPCPGASYTLSVACNDAPCQEDGISCLWSIPVDIDGDPVVVNNESYPASAPACGGFTANDGTVWFQVFGDGTTLTAHTCGSSIASTVITVYCDDCEFLGDLCIGGASDDGTFECANPSQASFEWCTEDGRLYNIAVRGSSGAVGDVSLHVTSDGVPCSEPANCELPLFCDGHCGDIAPQGCWCDDLCSFFGECCPGVCISCPELPDCIEVECDPCECPRGINENESCGDDVNDGCAGDPPSMNFHLANPGDEICGTVWAENDSRDTDWYRVTVPASGNISASLSANAPQVLFIVTANWDNCTDVNIVATGHSVDCEPVTVAASLPPGTDVAIFTAIGSSDGAGIFDGFPCGSCDGPGDWTYTLEIGEDEGPPPGSCEGVCGTGFGDPGCYDDETCICYCDEDCCVFDDCCPDKQAVCGGCAP